MEEDHMDSVSSSDSDDEEPEHVRKERIYAQLKGLKVALASNPNDYTTRVEIIKLLRASLAFDELKEHRDDLATLFPLPEDEWRRWLSDERQMLLLTDSAISADSIQRIVDLYERALADFLSVDLWLDYCDFLQSLILLDKGSQGDTMDVDDSDSESGSGARWSEIKDAASSVVNEQFIRDKFEEALRACAFHMTESDQLWDAYRVFELRAGTLAGIDDAAKRERLRKLFRRQLGSPNMKLVEVYTEYMNFERAATGSADFVCPFQDSYQKALELSVERQPYEENIASSTRGDLTKLDSWWKYLKFETQQKRPHVPRSVCLFERAVKVLPSVSQLWEAYIDFLHQNSTGSAKQQITSVCLRATRNCPFSSRLWSIRMRSLHRSGSSRDEIDKVLDVALKSAMSSSRDYLDVYQTYCELRCDSLQPTPSAEELESIRALFASSIEYFERWAADIAWEMRKSHALFEERRAKSVEHARAVWESIVRSDYARKNANAWLEFVRFEERRGETAKARTLLKQAVNAHCDNPEFIHYAWKEFERLGGGSQEEFDVAIHRILQQTLESEIAQLVASQAQPMTATATATDFDEAPVNKKSKKRPSEDNLSAERPAKRRRMEENVVEEGAKREKPVRVKTATDKHDPLVVHVSGFTADALMALSPEDIQTTFRELFFACGTVKSVRTVEAFSKHDAKDAPHSLKPFVYIEFETAEGAQKAVNTNPKIKWQASLPSPAEFELNAAFAQRIRPTAAGKAILQARAGAAPKYTDKFTVFVSNLSFKMTDKDLYKAATAIPNAPTPVGVRLIKDRENPSKSRGIAYIEYKDDAEVDFVAKALNGTLHNGRVIKAEKSRPTRGPAPAPSSTATNTNTSGPSTPSDKVEDAPASSSDAMQVSAPADSQAPPAAIEHVVTPAPAPAPAAVPKKPAFQMPVPRSVKVKPKAKIDIPK